MVSTNRFNLPAGNGKSMGDLVTDTLRRAIILRQIRLGERLVESKVAAELNVSITPLRHAFQKLASEGLIEVFPYRGSYVVTVTPEFIDDVRYCRRMVELAAAGEAYENLERNDPDCLLRTMEEGIAAYEKSGDILDVIDKDQTLHRTIVASARHKTLLAFWMQLSPRILLLQSYAKRQNFTICQFRERHTTIAEALSLRLGKKKFIDSLDANLEEAYSPSEVAIMLEEAGWTES